MLLQPILIEKRREFMKVIEWIKLNTNMCEDEKMRLIDSMVDYRDLIIYLWIRLLLQAGKVNDNGLIYLKKDLPYTKEMISILFNRPIELIEKGLEILEAFKMIKIYENNLIKICNWEKHQNIEGMKRVRESNNERVKNFREKKKKEKEALKDKSLEKENLNESEALINDENLNNAKAMKNAEAKSNNANESNKNKNCNANVTLQKEKREEEIKKKKKNIDKTERGEELKLEAENVKKSLEKINVKIKGLTSIIMEDMLTKYKEKYVRMAMGKAIEKNKLDVNYIYGILNNWLREGYPKTYEEIEFQNCEVESLSALNEKPRLRFNNFEPRQYDYKDLENQLLGWK